MIMAIVSIWLLLIVIFRTGLFGMSMTRNSLHKQGNKRRINESHLKKGNGSFFNVVCTKTTISTDFVME